MTNRRLFLVSGTAFVGLALAGCATVPAPLTFDLSSARAAIPANRRSSRTVVITLPKAVATYDSERVVVREAGGVLSYLPEAQWSDRLPSLLQTRLLQTFEDSAFANVGRPDDQLSVDLTLATEIRAFEIDVSAGAFATVSLSAKLVDEKRGAIPVSQLFTASVPTDPNSPSASVAGLNAAMRDVALQVLAWAASKA